MFQTGFNPKYRRPQRGEFSTSQCVEGILSGDRNALSYAITLTESQNATASQKAYEILKSLAQSGTQGYSKRITITGAPGAGKSTFIEHFGKYLLAKGHTLAVLAVDPSSQISYGSIMGDKTRMESLSTNQHAFIRPSSAGNMLGGVTLGTKESIFLCEKAGYEWIFVETVGVGQSESTSSAITDMTILLVQPGAGDDIQGIKRGILEMTDIIVVNKADGPQKDLADNTCRSYQSVLQLFQNRIEGYMPVVLTASAIENKGFDEIYNQIIHFFQHLEQKQMLGENRKEQEIRWFDFMIRERVLDWLVADSTVSQQLKGLKNEIADGHVLGFVALELAMKTIKNQGGR